MFRTLYPYLSFSSGSNSGFHTIILALRENVLLKNEATDLLDETTNDSIIDLATSIGNILYRTERGMLLYCDDERRHHRPRDIDWQTTILNEECYCTGKAKARW
jgi:hypothetical protein